MPSACSRTDEVRGFKGLLTLDTEDLAAWCDAVELRPVGVVCTDDARDVRAVRARVARDDHLLPRVHHVDAVVEHRDVVERAVLVLEAEGREAAHAARTPSR